MAHNYTDVIAIDESFIDDLITSASFDSGDSAWWVEQQVENALDSLIEKINEDKYLERKVVILKKKQRATDCNYPIDEVCPICEWEDKTPTKYWGEK